MVPEASPGVPERVRAERDLYCALLEVPPEPEEGWLKGILARLVELTGARRGYLEVYQPEPQRALTASYRCTTEEEAAIGARTSLGIVARTLADGRTLHVPMAMLDARFEANESVRTQQLEAVLCVPFPGRLPGVLYLEGERGRGQFTEADVAVAERVARYLGPAMGSLALSRGRGEDPTLPARQRLKLTGVVGRSRALARVLDQMALVASNDATVLFLGDTGTGKTALARGLHDSGPLAAREFVHVNCATLQPNLAEAELFGTLPGAFTGARLTPGLVRAAEGGTLFLDEVAELTLEVQAKLLQLLSERRYSKVGDTRREKADVRVLAATNVDLQAAVRAGRFRTDLYHRLAPFPIRVPTLAERREDLPDLVDALLERSAEELNLPHLPAAPSLYSAVEIGDWPGNLRDLANALQRALLVAADRRASRVEGLHLNPDLPAGSRSLAQQVETFRRDLVQRELRDSRWNVAEVARRLEVARQTIYNVIRAHDLSPEEG